MVKIIRRVHEREGAELERKKEGKDTQREREREQEREREKAREKAVAVYQYLSPVAIFTVNHINRTP